MVNHVNASKNKRFKANEFAPMNKGKQVESGPLIIQPTFTPKQYNRIIHMLDKEETYSN